MNYFRCTGGGSGGGAVLINKTIRNNGVYNAADDNADGFSRVTVDIPSFEILKGDNVPSDSIGENGQLYLQTIKGVRQDLSLFGGLIENNGSTMSVNLDKNGAYFKYNAGPYLGAQLFNQFDLTDVDKIKIKVDSSAPSYNDYGTLRYSPLVIIENTISPTTNYIANTITQSATGETYNIPTQGDSVTFDIDVSNLTGYYWIVLSCIGATAKFSDLYLCSDSADAIVCDSFAKVSDSWQKLIDTNISDIITN